MGFMDKAKKMAEQAQAKLDEAQQQFNSGQQQGGPSAGGPVTEYDKHGRPSAEPAPETAAAPPTGDPLAQTSTPPPATAAGAAPVPDPAAPAPGVDGPPPSAAAAQPGTGGGLEEDRNHPSHEPPSVTKGDPLAG